MRKALILALCLMLLLCGCSEFTYTPEENPEWAKAGITAEEFRERLQEKGFENGYLGWYVTARKGNQVIVARTNWTDYAYDETIVAEVRTYTITEAPPDENFTKIEAGMDLFQVVELIGDVPMTIGNMNDTIHKDSQGNRYKINWEFNEDAQKGVVLRAYKLEE